MFEVLEYAPNQLPQDKPRYLMGVGKPDDIVGQFKEELICLTVFCQVDQGVQAKHLQGGEQLTCETLGIETIKDHWTKLANAHAAKIIAEHIYITFIKLVR